MQRLFKNCYTDILCTVGQFLAIYFYVNFVLEKNNEIYCLQFDLKYSDTCVTEP